MGKECYNGINGLGKAKEEIKADSGMQRGGKRNREREMCRKISKMWKKLARIRRKDGNAAGMEIGMGIDSVKREKKKKKRRIW